MVRTEPRTHCVLSDDLGLCTSRRLVALRLSASEELELRPFPKPRMLKFQCGEESEATEGSVE